MGSHRSLAHHRGGAHRPAPLRRTPPPPSRQPRRRLAASWSHIAAPPSAPPSVRRSAGRAASYAGLGSSPSPRRRYASNTPSPVATLPIIATAALRIVATTCQMSAPQPNSPNPADSPIIVPSAVFPWTRAGATSLISPVVTDASSPAKPASSNVDQSVQVEQPQDNRRLAGCLRERESLHDVRDMSSHRPLGDQQFRAHLYAG